MYLLIYCLVLIARFEILKINVDNLTCCTCKGPQIAEMLNFFDTEIKLSFSNDNFTTVNNNDNFTIVRYRNKYKLTQAHILSSK